VQATLNSTGFAAFTLSNVSVPVGSGTTFTATASLSGELIVTKFLATSEFSAPIPIGGNVNNLFVASAYGLLLNRYPDTGAGYWANLLNNGASAPGVVLGLEGSMEYLNNQVNSMYKLYLGRNPDTGGEQYWVNFLQSGGTLEEVAEGLTSSQEYYVLQGGTNQGFITGLYQEVLKRTPSTSELAGWETAMNNGASQLDVSIAFLTSQEYRTDLVENDYMTFLLRQADTGGLSHWVNALNSGATDQEVLAQIFGSPEGYQLWS
jgi:thermitase